MIRTYNSFKHPPFISMGVTGWFTSVAFKYITSSVNVENNYIVGLFLRRVKDELYSNAVPLNEILSFRDAALFCSEL